MNKMVYLKMPPLLIFFFSISEVHILIINILCIFTYSIYFQGKNELNLQIDNLTYSVIA